MLIMHSTQLVSLFFVLLKKRKEKKMNGHFFLVPIACPLSSDPPRILKHVRAGRDHGNGDRRRKHEIQRQSVGSVARGNALSENVRISLNYEEMERENTGCGSDTVLH